MNKHILAVFCILLSITTFTKAQNQVKNGVLDLRQHNWQKDGIVNISGDWEFYWNNFYSPGFFSDSSNSISRTYAYVPDFWNKYITTPNENRKGFGFGTYHVKVLCPSSPEPLALKVFTVQGAYKLFINGKPVAEMGKTGQTSSTTKAKLEPAIINVQPEGGVLDIVMHVSNFNDKRGGLWDIVRIGTEKEITENTIRYLSVDFIIAGVFLLAFTYNLILFFHFRKRYALLYFSLLCLIIFIRIIVTDEIPINYIFNFNWALLRRIEFISFYFSVPVMSLFSYYLFREDFSKKALYFILPVSALFILTSMFASYYTYTYIVTWYQAFMMITAVYGLFVFIKAAINKRKGSYLFITGFIIFLASIINDLLYVNLAIETIPLFYIGIAIFTIILSLILSKQFSEIFNVLEITNKQLAEANRKLGIMNKDIQHKNSELKKINQELDSFVNRTSHDLRAPLNSVAGVTDLMENETNVSMLHDYAELQKKTLLRMDNLIKDIIDFSKYKKLQLTFEEINFSEIVNDSLEDHKYLKNAENIEIKPSILQEEKFISDKRRISTIINNLFSNSIKYADLTKQEPLICINISVNNHSAVIEVKDNGIGIEENKMGKIFNMFYRATSNSTGFGLGLYIIKETVEKLGGSIAFNSKFGEGTNIKIKLPDKRNELNKKNIAAKNAF